MNGHLGIDGDDPAVVEDQVLRAKQSRNEEEQESAHHR
jgi:hypothetical protein